MAIKMSLRPKKRTPLKRRLNAIEEDRRKKRVFLRNQIALLGLRRYKLREAGKINELVQVENELGELYKEQYKMKRIKQDEIDRTTWSKKTLKKHGIKYVRMTEDPPLLILKLRGEYKSQDTHMILNSIRWLSVTMGIATHDSFTDWERRYVKYDGDKITITFDTTKAIMRELEIDEGMFQSFS